MDRVCRPEGNLGELENAFALDLSELEEVFALDLSEDLSELDEAFTELEERFTLGSRENRTRLLEGATRVASESVTDSLSASSSSLARFCGGVEGGVGKAVRVGVDGESAA